MLPPLSYPSSTCGSAHYTTLGIQVRTCTYSSAPINVHTHVHMYSTTVVQTSLDDLGYHVEVLMSFLQLGCCDPDQSVSGNVLTSLVEHLAGILIGLKLSQCQPEL